MKKLSIPKGVYYAEDNFYSMKRMRGMGVAFYKTWKAKSHLFPGRPNVQIIINENLPADQKRKLQGIPFVTTRTLAKGHMLRCEHHGKYFDWPPAKVDFIGPFPYDTQFSFDEVEMFKVRVRAYRIPNENDFCTSAHVSSS